MTWCPRRATAPPLRLRLRSGTAARQEISYETNDRKPDGGWGHFKPSRWGQCKPSLRVTATYECEQPLQVGHWIEVAGVYLVVERIVPAKRGDRYAGIALCKLALG